MFFKKPSHNHDWSPDQALLPYAEFLNNKEVQVHNIRNIFYRTEDDFDVRHYNARYDTSTIESVWFLLEPFGPPGVAHTILSFRFADGRTLALSVEVRKKRGEKYSLWRMVPRQYELMYVLADERDVVRLRALIWKEKAYFFPLAIPNAQADTMLRDILKRVNSMYVHAEFYHPTANNCTNNLTIHMRAAGIKLPRFHPLYVFPAGIVSLFYRYGLLPKGKTPGTVMQKYYVNERAKTCQDIEHFSDCIRGGVSL